MGPRFETVVRALRKTTAALILVDLHGPVAVQVRRRLLREAQAILARLPGGTGVVLSPRRRVTDAKPRLHKVDTYFRAVCGVAAYRYRDRRSGASVDDWNDVTCTNCLAKK